MPIDDEVQYSLAYAPSSYSTGIDPEAEGRWTTVGNLGTLWTDDADSLGFISAPEGDPVENSTLIQLISQYKDMGLPADGVFDALSQIYGDSEIKTGKLAAVAESAAITAAAPEPEAEPATGEEIFAAFRDDSFVAVGRAAPDGMYVRDNGEWQLLPSTDLRFDDTEWLPLDAEGVAKYDEAEKSGTTLAREDVEGPAPRS